MNLKMLLVATMTALGLSATADTASAQYRGRTGRTVVVQQTAVYGGGRYAPSYYRQPSYITPFVNVGVPYRGYGPAVYPGFGYGSGFGYGYGYGSSIGIGYARPGFSIGYSRSFR